MKKSYHIMYYLLLHLFAFMGLINICCAFVATGILRFACIICVVFLALFFAAVYNEREIFLNDTPDNENY